MCAARRPTIDGWAQMGARGWSWDDVLPYFKKSEHYVQGGDPELRGQGGPLKVEDYRTILPLTHYFVKAAQRRASPSTPTSTASSAGALATRR
jgi:choline dehydrogenase